MTLSLITNSYVGLDFKPQIYKWILFTRFMLFKVNCSKYAHNFPVHKYSYTSWIALQMDAMVWFITLNDNILSS